MEELLKEVALSERRKEQIDSFVQTVTELLQTVPESPEVEVLCGSNPSILVRTSLYTGTFNHMFLLNRSLCSGERPVMAV